MTFCPECGKPVAPKAKFCRNCGASQLDDALAGAVPVDAPVAAPVAAPVRAPLPSPAPAPAIPVQPPRAPVVPLQAAAPPVAAPPVTTSLCGACGSPLSLSEKFCGVCGARAGQVAAAALIPPAPSTPVYSPIPTPAAVPIPPPVPVPAPVMSQPSGARTCNSCGNAIKPGDKYCSKCLAIVRDNPPQAASPQFAVPAPAPEQPSPAAAPGSYVCSSCGSPVTGTEKFCGICGAPVVASRVPASVPPQPVQKTCNACGAPVSDTTKFCGGCGAPVGVSFRAAPVTPTAPLPVQPP